MLLGGEGGRVQEFISKIHFKLVLHQAELIYAVSGYQKVGSIISGHLVGIMVFYEKNMIQLDSIFKDIHDM